MRSSVPPFVPLFVVGALLGAACSGTASPTGGSATATSATATSATGGDTTATSATGGDTTATSATGGDTAASAGTPASLAATLSVIERGLLAPGLSPDAADELGRREQRVYRAILAHPEWQAQLLSLVDPVALGPLTLHFAARQAQVDHNAGKPVAQPSSTVPAWNILAPLPVDELRRYYDQAQATTGVRWEYLAAIHFQETRMGRVVGTSSAGAVGPMQFLPATWAKCCTGDPTNTQDAILGAARFLALHGAPGDMRRALTAYNPNSGYVGAVTAYAQNMIADAHAFLGYHGWEVFYTTRAGTVRLPVGYASAVPIDVDTYLRAHPADLVTDG